LLVRACVAWFWHKPYRSARAQRLTRWGTGLHDRFLLPSFVKLDFEDALAELGQGGFHFDIDWFAPQFGWAHLAHTAYRYKIPTDAYCP
ncbi:MAG: hypothetical protein EBW39_03410, partial [Betaproteobacteria bacterium]|nr:hypothetical protein [Betaproteobacteria bacterium]